MTFLKYLILFTSIMKTPLLVANSEVFLKGNEAGKSFASERNQQQVGNLAKEMDPGLVPQYQGEDVEAKKYYESGVKIEEEAQQISTREESAQFIMDSKNKRPSSERGGSVCDRFCFSCFS